MRTHRVFLSLVASLFVSAGASAATLPSDEDVSGIMKLCGLGRYQAIEGDVKGRIELWKREAEASGKASAEDLGGLLSTLPAGQQIDPNVYKTYVECIEDAISQFLQSQAPKTETWGSVEAYHNSGAGNLAGDAITHMRVTNIIRRSANVDIDYSYNTRHLEEQPITISAYLLTTSQNPANVGKEVAAAGGCDDREQADISSTNVGTASLTVCVDQQSFESSNSLHTHELFVYLAGTTIQASARGKVLAQADPYVCQRFPFSYTWQ